MTVLDKISSQASIGEHWPAWLLELKESASQEVKERGLPTKRDEDWKYLDLSALFEQPWSTAAHHEDTCSLTEVNTIPFINGTLQEKALNKLPEGVIALSIRDALDRFPAKVEEILNLKSKEPFSLANLSLFNSGVFIYLKAGVQCDEVVLLKHLSNAFGARHLRHLIYLEEGARLKLIEQYEGQQETVYFNNVVTQVILKESAELTLCRLQVESKEAFQISETNITLAVNSKFTQHNFDFGAKLARHAPVVQFQGEKASATLNGLYCLNGNQHVDNHTTLAHQVPHCDSSQLYKGILNAKSRAVFNGRVCVDKDAQKTNSSQQNKNLLLSERAEIDTKPELQIFADDVKCAHGATVGQLDESALFYLRSRGISKKEARKLVIASFANQLLDSLELSQAKVLVSPHLELYLEEVSDD